MSFLGCTASLYNDKRKTNPPYTYADKRVMCKCQATRLVQARQNFRISLIWVSQGFFHHKQPAERSWSKCEVLVPQQSVNPVPGMVPIVKRTAMDAKGGMAMYPSAGASATYQQALAAMQMQQQQQYVPVTSE